MTDDFDDVGSLRREIARLHEKLDRQEERHCDGMARMIARANLMASWISGRLEQQDEATAVAVSITLGDSSWRKTPNRMNGGVK